MLAFACDQVDWESNPWQVWAATADDNLKCVGDPFDDFDEDDFDDDFDDDFEEEWDEDLPGDQDFESEFTRDDGGGFSREDSDFDD